MPEEQNSHKKDVKAGIFIAILLVVAVLIFQGVSNIKIVKKKKVVQQQTATTTQVADNAKTSKSKETDVNTSESIEKVDENSQVIKKVVNQSSLDFTKAEMETTGYVKSKEMYLQGNQILYLLNITIGAGASSTDVKYYCPYDTFKQVNENDVLTVRYQQLSESTFGITSVSK